MDAEQTKLTSMILPVSVWRSLRRLAEDRAIAKGTRPSTGRVVSDLVRAEEARREGVEDDASRA